MPSCAKTLARAAATLGILLALTACAATPDSQPADPYAPIADAQPNDPAEALNRPIYRFNRFLRRKVISKVARLYNSPEFAPVRVPLSNVLGNLQAPLVFLNDLAQGRVCAASVTLSRFMVNSTFGLGGAMDLARDRGGLEGHSNSIAQTLAVWGVPEGPYLVLPILGPGNLRSVTGLGAELLLDPVDQVFAGAGIAEMSLPRDGLGFFDDQASIVADLEKLDSTSVDGYAALRSAFRQTEAGFGTAPECPAALGDSASVQSANAGANR